MDSQINRQHLKKAMIPLGLFFILAFAYLLAIPSGESPDEGGHVQCIEQVSLLNRLPIMEPKPTGQSWARTYALSGIVCYHMPGYYLLAGTLQEAVHTFTEQPLHYEFPPSNPNGPSPNMFLHAAKTSPFPLEEPATMTILRLFSLLLWAGMCLLTYGIARRLAPQQTLAAPLAVTILAGWPQFVFMSRAINNDALAIPLSILVLWLLLDVGKPNRYVWVTLLACLAVLTKLTNLYLLILLALVIPAEIWWMPNNRKRYLFPMLISVALVLGTALLITQHPVLSQHAQYTFRVTSRIAERASTWAYWGDVAALTLRSGWVGFGMMNIFAPQWQVNLWWLLVGLSLLAGLVWFIRLNWHRPTFKMHAFIIFLWTSAIVGGYLRINLNRFQPQFRYLFALLPLITFFAGLGLEWVYGRFTPSSSRAASYLLLLLAGILLLANGWIIWQIVMPAYGVFNI